MENSALPDLRQAIIVVGLGNTDPAWKHSRHNAGFEALDKYAEVCAADFAYYEELKAYLAVTYVNEVPVLLVKPAYSEQGMNESGLVVRAILNQTGGGSAGVLVVYDEIDLDGLQVKFKVGQKTYRHNGLKSVVENLPETECVLLKVAVGPKTDKAMDIRQFVLSPLAESTDEFNCFQQNVSLAADAIGFWCQHGTELASRQFNGRK